MTAWPKTEFVFLRWTVAAMVVLCAWLAILGVREAISGSLIAGLIGLVIWLTIAVGLYRLMQMGTVARADCPLVNGTFHP